MKAMLFPKSSPTIKISAKGRQTACALATAMLLLSTGVQASVLAVNYGGDYVNTSTTLNGSNVVTQSGDNRWDIRGDSSLTTALSPTSGYTGPTFYGALGIASSAVGGGIGSPSIFTSQILDNGSNDEIYVKLQAAVKVGLLAGAHQFVLFKKADFMNGLNASTVSLDNTTSFSLSANAGPDGNTARFGEGRFLVMNGSTLYVSQSTWTLTSSMPVSLIPTSTSWAVYSPTATDLNFNQAGATFTSMSFSDVTGLGFYAERDVMGDSGNYNLSVPTFSVTAVPEPSTHALLGLSFLLVLGFLRRRSASRL